MKVLNNKGQGIETQDLFTCAEFIAETSETNSVFTVEISDRELEDSFLEAYSHELWRSLFEIAEASFYVERVSYNTFKIIREW